MMTTSIIITTKNRCDELRRAVRSAVGQLCCSEVLVFDDGSSDGTSQMIRTEFPSVRLERVKQSLGIVSARNRAIESAKGDVVITIDDDCVFSSTDTVVRTVADFDAPKVGAVAIPHINVYGTPAAVPAPLPAVPPYVISEFAGGSNAILREVFRALGGYRSAIWRQGEEYDFCTRLLEKGWVTRMGTATPIKHFESPNRNAASIHFHKVRSHILYAWWNVPNVYLPVHISATIAKTIVDAAGHGHLLAGLAGLRAGLSGILTVGGRHPVCKQAYRLMRQLRRRGITPLSEITQLLPQSRIKASRMKTSTAA